MHAACEYGVFQFVHEAVLSSHSFVDEGIAQKQHYASALHKLVIQFFNAARYVHYELAFVGVFCKNNQHLYMQGACTGPCCSRQDSLTWDQYPVLQLF